MKLQKSGKGYHITIPKNIVEGFNWQKGQDFKIEITGKGLLLKQNI